MGRHINQEGKALIKRFESLQLHAYRCPAGIWTIGYGHTGDVEPHHVITEHQADVVLDLDLAHFEEWVESVAPHTNDNQFSALVSFAFNVGTGAAGTSTLFRYVKEARYGAAADEFLKWTHAAGKVLHGLVTRRAAERLLFLK
jgi:lysozyme